MKSTKLEEKERVLFAVIATVYNSNMKYVCMLDSSLACIDPEKWVCLIAL
jgi:hypothetical protein